MSKKAKKILTYFLVFIGIVLMAFLGLFALLYIMPGTSILGYEYFYINKVEEKIIPMTELSANSAVAFKIKANKGSVSIKPNSQSDKIKIVYTQNAQGITKSTDSEIVFKTDYSVENYEYDNSSYKSLILTALEPSFFSVFSSSKIEIFLPNSRSFSVVSCDSARDVTFVSSLTENTTITQENGTEQKQENIYNLSIGRLYLNVNGGGNIYVDSDVVTKNGETKDISQTINFYYFKINNGSVQLKNNNSLTANQMVIEGNSGNFKFKNAGEATLNLSNGLIINSTNNGNLDVNIDKLLGPLKINATTGKFEINEIGSDEARQSVVINSCKATYKFGNVFGYVSLANMGENPANTVEITNLVNKTTNDNMFEIGNGYLCINNLEGNSNFSSKGGYMVCKNINKNTSVNVLSDSGTINLTYEKSNQAITTTYIDVFTNTGDIYINNISGLLHLEVFKKSSNSLINLNFSAVSYSDDKSIDNYINANDRVVNIALIGITDDFIFRLLTNSDVAFSENIRGLVSQVNSQDLDYVLNQEKYSSYQKEYRVGYFNPTSSAEFNSYGKMLIKTSATTKIFANT